MLILAILLFFVAAILGLYLLSFILQNKNTPKGVAFTHGPLAAAGLILLIIYALFNTPAPIVSIIIFILAALGGIMLIYRDITGKSLPKWMAVGHGLTAIVGFIFLILFTFF
ncbi:MAG: hypothetical protein ABI597_09785 [Gammaproteobacteria bacterium]